MSKPVVKEVVVVETNPTTAKEATMNTMNINKITTVEEMDLMLEELISKLKGQDFANAKEAKESFGLAAELIGKYGSDADKVQVSKVIEDGDVDAIAALLSTKLFAILDGETVLVEEEKKESILQLAIRLMSVPFSLGLKVIKTIGPFAWKVLKGLWVNLSGLVIATGKFTWDIGTAIVQGLGMVGSAVVEAGKHVGSATAESWKENMAPEFKDIAASFKK